MDDDTGFFDDIDIYIVGRPALVKWVSVPQAMGPPRFEKQKPRAYRPGLGTHARREECCRKVAGQTARGTV